MNEKASILVVDDCITERNIICKNLRNWGYKVYAAENGQQALIIFAKVQPAIVLLDYMLPGMDGYVTCKRLHEINNINAKILMMTAYNSSETAEKAFLAGAEEYLPKPINYIVLKHRLHRILTARKSEFVLRENEEKMQGIFNNAVVGIGITNNRGQFVYANKKCSDMLGYNLNELYKLNVADLTCAEDLQIFRCLLAKMHDKEISEYHFEKRFIRKDKSVFWGYISATAVYKDNGQLDFIIGVITDITDRIIEKEKLKASEAALRRQNEYLIALNEVTMAMMNRLDLDEVFSGIVHRAVDLFQNASGNLYLLKENGIEVELRVAVGIAQHAVGSNFSKEEGLVGRVLKTGRPFIVDDYHNWKESIKNLPFDIPSSAVGLPLFSGQRIIGVIVLMSNNSTQLFGDEECMLLERFAAIASIAYDNAILYHQAQQEIADRKAVEERLRYMSFNDSLTGLYNRAYMHEQIKFLIESQCESLGIIMCDVDGLKQVNDKLGHVFGDQLLIAAAPVLKQCFSDDDIVVRMGGDEFAILMPGATQERVEYSCQKVKQQIDKANLELIDFKLSISIGWVVGNLKNQNIKELFIRADQNMYLDKMQKKQQRDENYCILNSNKL